MHSRGLPNAIIWFDSPERIRMDRAVIYLYKMAFSFHFSLSLSLSLSFSLSLWDFRSDQIASESSTYETGN